MDNTLSLDYQQTDFGREFAEEVERLDGRIDGEIEARSEADNNLQGQIDTIKASSDVVDIVGTHAELEEYDTSKLNDNDIVKVLEDETHDGDITYYRWSTSAEAFSFVGSLSAYYSKGETDTLLSGKQDTLTAGTNIQINDNVISATGTAYTAGTNVQISAGNVISATDTTYSAFTGATSSTAGAEGLVPAPVAGDDTKYLSGDGTWKTINAGSVTVLYNNYDSTTGALYSDSAMTTAVKGEDVEAAFSRGKVIICYKSSSNGNRYVEVVNLGYFRWSANYLDVGMAMASGTRFTVYFHYNDKTTTTCSRQTTTFQEPLTAGSNISITSGPNGETISATDTTYSDFTGATSSVAGASGLVPAPVAGDQNKVLKGDGTWGDASAVKTLYIGNTMKYISEHQRVFSMYSDAAMTQVFPWDSLRDAMTKGGIRFVYNDPNGGYYIYQVYCFGDWDDNSYDVPGSNQHMQYCVTLTGDDWYFLDHQNAPMATIDGAHDLQLALTAGSNITIAGTTISATDTTYSAFTGATSSVAGSAGLVPAPTTSDPDKFLKGDGTWGAVTTNALLIKEWS